MQAEQAGSGGGNARAPQSGGGRSRGAKAGGRRSRGGQSGGRRESDVSSIVRSGAEAVREQATQKVAEVTQRVREGGETFLSQQKERAASGLDGVGDAIREAGNRLKQENLGGAAQYIGAAADGIERASHYLRERSVGELTEDVQELARRRPELFLGGMLLAGLAVARFVKASRPRPRRVPNRGRSDAASGQRRRPGSGNSRGNARA